MRKPQVIALIGLLVVALAACTLPTLKVYTQTFTRATTLQIDKIMEDNGSVMGAGPTVLAAYICKYAVGIPPIAASCGVLVATAYLRIQDVMGQIRRSNTQKCLKLEYHLALVVFVVSFVNAFATECLFSPWANGVSAWTLDGQPVAFNGMGAGGGGGGDW